MEFNKGDYIININKFKAALLDKLIFAFSNNDMSDDNFTVYFGGIINACKAFEASGQCMDDE